jgi:NADPH-dependent 2,4-dienoyl-CoA reductase/sulfur reductase-like enzyme/nitrite reductase/ring-hydroxylating ferredoxin subunit
MGVRKMASVPPIDLRQGVLIQELADGAILQGHIGAEEAILLRRGNEFFAIGAQCSHYHGALAAGLVVDDTIRCPLHHACFSLRTGAALRAPAFDPVACWRVERSGDQVFVREKMPESKRPPISLRPAAKPLPDSVVILGGGAAGLAAADRLRAEGYEAPITLVSADDSPPYDRPNLSKDFLAGTAPAEWMPLRGAEYYAQQQIDLLLNTRVTALDTAKRSIALADGRQIKFGALLIATGADPVRLDIPGSGAMQRFYLRSFADSRAIIAALGAAQRVLVIGASFIGLEVAASLRQRRIDVQVVGTEHIPLERVLGPQVGTFVRELHESHGVEFHLDTSVARIDDKQVTLKNGTTLEADMVILGVGVRPSIALADQAGLIMDRGISVNEYLETSVAGIYAAGDVARWPDVHSGDRIRVEHWVVAQRQGQVAALNILGQAQRFDAVPFFWSQHFDTTINYVGHAESFDAVEINGSLAAKNCTLTYKRGGQSLAVASISRNLDSLQAERDMEVSKASVA